MPEVVPTINEPETEVVENIEDESLINDESELENSENTNTEENADLNSENSETNSASDLDSVPTTASSKNETTSEEFDEESAGYEVLTKGPKPTSSATGCALSFILMVIAVCLI